MGYSKSSILSEEEALNFFEDLDDSQTTASVEEEEDEKENNSAEDDSEEDEEELDGPLFEDNPEEVGSEDDIKNKGGIDSATSKGSSQNPNIYSSIAQALVDEGTFQFLNDEAIESAQDAEGFADLFRQELEARLDETQKRVNDALNYGVEPSEIQRHENALNQLNSVSDDAITDESEQGETLRKQLIYTDLIQKGMSDERAKREVKKSFDAGTDIDDARDALESCKSFVKGNYDKLIKEAKDSDSKKKADLKKNAETLKKDIMESETFFGDLKLDKSTRQSIYDSIMKPVTTKDGQNLTAVQKYQQENPVEFLKNLGIVFTLTNGFKNLDKLVEGRVKKEKKEGLKKLEQVINSSRRNSDGSLNFSAGVSEDFFGKGIKGFDI